MSSASVKSAIEGVGLQMVFLLAELAHSIIHCNVTRQRNGVRASSVSLRIISGCNSTAECGNYSCAFLSLPGLQSRCGDQLQILSRRSSPTSWRHLPVSAPILAQWLMTLT